MSAQLYGLVRSHMCLELLKTREISVLRLPGDIFSCQEQCMFRPLHIIVCAFREIDGPALRICVVCFTSAPLCKVGCSFVRTSNFRVNLKCVDAPSAKYFATYTCDWGTTQVKQLFVTQGFSYIEIAVRSRIVICKEGITKLCKATK